LEFNVQEIEEEIKEKVRCKKGRRKKQIGKVRKDK